MDALAQLKPLAAECADASTWPLSDDTLVDCLDTIHQITAAVTAAELHLIREIDGRGLPVARHATSTDRLPEFVPPAYVDPQRRPRRNIYHLRT